MSNLSHMNPQHPVSGAFPSSSEHIERLRQVLEVARDEADLASTANYGPHVEDALAEIANALREHLGSLAAATDEDNDLAEEYGEMERKRRSWFPVYRAA